MSACLIIWRCPARDRRRLAFDTRVRSGANRSLAVLSNSAYSATDATASARAAQRKNWDSITTDILSSEKAKTTNEDANVGGDNTVNEFFQKIFGDADEDTKKAMMKSYSESGGTTLSTNWDEVKKEKVTVKPPEGQVWKNWG